MQALTRIRAGVIVSHEQVLAARESRAARQAAALARFDRPVVSMTVVMPGPVKDGVFPRRVLAEALREIHDLSRRRRWPMLWQAVTARNTGPDAIYVFDVQPQILKAATVELEDRHPLGRLWDLDVIAPGPRILSRQEFGLPARRCLVCEQPASECGRSQLHPLEELLDVMQGIVNAYDRNLHT